LAASSTACVMGESLDTEVEATTRDREVV
jgi:hypothetical protein